MKTKIKIYDHIFSNHAYTMSNGTMNIEPEYFTWYKGDNPCDIGIYTDFDLSDINTHKGKHKYNIALLMESPGVFSGAYNQIKKLEAQFDYIFTFSEELLKRGDKYIKYLLGGTWIPKSDWAIYHKTKMVSMIASEKTNTHGQRLRHEIANEFKSKIDIYGAINNNPINNKLDGLKQYRYSIVTENCNTDTYFTEKLIDCFLTGTIPIYCGSKKVADYFMGNGIIYFETIEELKRIFETLYAFNVIIPAVSYNFTCTQQYVMPENMLGNKLKEMGVL